MIVQNKTCPSCEKTFHGNSVEELSKYFGWRNKKQKKLATYCKQCQSEMNKLRYERNKEEIQERHRQYYQENKDKFKEYYQENREERIEQNRKWQKENPEIRQKINSKYYSKNKDKFKEYYQEKREIILQKYHSEKLSNK